MCVSGTYIHAMYIYIYMTLADQGAARAGEAAGLAGNLWLDQAVGGPAPLRYSVES